MIQYTMFKLFMPGKPNFLCKKVDARLFSLILLYRYICFIGFAKGKTIMFCYFEPFLVFSKEDF